jgi:hypothetical protein
MSPPDVEAAIPSSKLINIPISRTPLLQGDMLTNGPNINVFTGRQHEINCNTFQGTFLADLRPSSVSGFV